MDGLHEKYGGMASFYHREKLIYSINDEEVLSKEPNPTIPLIQSFRNFRSEPKSMERQRFRQVKKWLQGKKKFFFGNSGSYSAKVILKMEEKFIQTKRYLNPAANLMNIGKTTQAPSTG